LNFPADKIPQKWRSAGAGQCLGIDHSAISVADAATSIAFYQALGLNVTARSLNAGPEQDALDGLSSVHVEVVALSPDAPTPHVELLCYQTSAHPGFAAHRSNDIACTRLVFEGAIAPQGISDPDGHQLIFLPVEYL
ncbi:MAG TPA: VOC family protein, partial [Rhizomicrobium sp.]